MAGQTKKVGPRPWGGTQDPVVGSSGETLEWDRNACFFNIINYTVFSLSELQEVQTYVKFKSRLEFRSSHSQMFYRINVLNNFAKFTRKHLCWSLVFRPSPVTLLKKTSAQVFSCESTSS